MYCTGTQIIQKSSSPLQIVVSRWVAWRQFPTEDPQIFGATVQNLVARTTWATGICALSGVL
jgi:hypothetical protein